MLPILNPAPVWKPDRSKRSIAEVVHDHKRDPGGWYELVSGPVAAFWEQRVAMEDSDQFSFHGEGIRVLNALISHAKGKGLMGTGDPDLYQWVPVP